MKSKTRHKPKILVVDDEPDNLDLLYRTFYREYKVLKAESGPKALEMLAREQDVAVIISDQRMPIMSGTEFLSLAAVQYPDIIRILLTGYTDVEDLVEAINSGKVFKYVTKPWQKQDLTEVVTQALETHDILKVRTAELRHSLRRESLLNTVTNTIRSAQYGRIGDSPLREVLQTIVNTVGQVLDVDLCILRSFDEGDLAAESFGYQRADLSGEGEIKGLELTVWETREIQVLHNVGADESLQRDRAQSQAFATAEICSTLIVPLVCQQDLMAVLGLHRCGAPRNWPDDEVQLAVMVADQAALAISQARAYERVQSLARREALVNTITSTIRSSLDPQAIFTAITQELGTSLEVDGCALSLWTAEDEFVQCVGLYDRFSSPNGGGATASSIREESQSPASEQLPQSVAPIEGNPVLQQLLETQQPVVLKDLAAATAERMSGEDLPLRSPARALLVVPLLDDGKIIGSISLRQTRQPRRWSAADIELAQAVAAQAAIAVQQSRLYQTTRQQAERLLELDRQKTEFFQNVSHELRTPLTLTIGPLETAVSHEQGLPFEQAQIALRNSRRLLQLVNQLLDIQRLDAGQMRGSFSPCNLKEFIEQIAETFRPYCRKKRLQLATEIEACPPVYLDAEKFDKVIYNLLSNAMKFTESGGKITVQVATQGDRIRLDVRDTGIGIDAAQLPYIFDRFRQAEGSISRSHEGTGLGLALVKEMVELHGGEVTVESVKRLDESSASSHLREGTTFTIWLPTGTQHLPPEQVEETPTEVQIARAAVELADLESELLDLEREPIAAPLAPPADAKHSDSEPSPSQSLILVVDDNPDLRTYVSHILQSAGYPVCLARNGEEGFQQAQARRPRLIVTDLMMPKVSGLDLIALARNHAELKGTPIVLLTAKADEDSRIVGTEQGADAYLAKPFNDRELLAEVRNLLALKENEERVKQLNQYLTESVLSRFLPSSLVQRAATGELSLNLRPEPRLVTILFSDIVGFTQLANTLRSRRVAQMLNEYLAAMTEVVFANGGTVDKFMGDAILALFGAPEDLTPNEQVQRAIATARAMHQTLKNLNQQWQEQGIFDDGVSPLQFRCGVHQGTSVVGMFGGEQRSDYTAIGPAVNIASRLQEAAEPNRILVSAAVADYLEEEEITKFSPLKLKGIDETVLTFLVN